MAVDSPALQRRLRTEERPVSHGGHGGTAKADFAAEDSKVSEGDYSDCPIGPTRPIGPLHRLTAAATVLMRRHDPVKPQRFDPASEVPEGIDTPRRTARRVLDQVIPAFLADHDDEMGTPVL